MKYIVIDYSNNANLVQKAKEFAWVIIKLSTPDTWRRNKSRSKWAVFNNSTINTGCMSYDETYQIPLKTHYPNGSVNDNALEVIQELYDMFNWTVTKIQFRNYVLNNDFATIDQILANVNIPSTITIMNQATWDLTHDMTEINILNGTNLWKQVTL